MTLKDYRIKTGKTQDDVAQTLQMNRASYTNIENGKRRPSVECAKRIADLLEFDWTKFYTGKAADSDDFI